MAGDSRDFVIDALTSRGASLFTPLDHSPDVDLVARAGHGQYAEVCLASATGPSTLSVRLRRQRPTMFIVGVLAAPGGLSEAWVLPSGVFDRFASGPSNDSPRDLNLDSPKAEPLRERLSVYKDRWALITEFAKYRSTMTDPQALQVQLALG